MSSLRSLETTCPLCGRHVAASKGIHVSCQERRAIAERRSQKAPGQATPCETLTCRSCKKVFPFRLTGNGFRAEYCDPKCARQRFKSLYVPAEKEFAE